MIAITLYELAMPFHEFRRKVDVFELLFRLGKVVADFRVLGLDFRFAGRNMLFFVHYVCIAIG